MAEHKALNIRNFPEGLLHMYKAICSLRGYTIREGIIGLVIDDLKHFKGDELKGRIADAIADHME